MNVLEELGLGRRGVSYDTYIDRTSQFYAFVRLFGHTSDQL